MMDESLVGLTSQSKRSMDMAEKPVKNQKPEEDEFITQIKEDEHRELEERERKQNEQREKWREAKRRQAGKPLYPPELMSIIQSIEGYAASQPEPKVDIFKAISETNNSNTLYSVMLKAALRISWLQKRPELDEASAKYYHKQKQP